jgi:hypothetical protein
MGIKKMREMLGRLKQLRSRAAMETMDIGKDTDDIKAKTKLYRDTWVVFPIDQMISDLELEIAKRNK